MIHRYVPAVIHPAPFTLLVLHGTGGDEQSLLGLARQLAPAANLLSPRGSVLENGMPRFFRRFAEGVFDLDDLWQRAGELIEFIADSAKQYGFDGKRVVTLGYSNGANIAAAAMLRDPTPFLGAALWRAMFTSDRAGDARLDGRRVLITSGTRDPIVPAESVDRLVETLADRGATVDTQTITAGHELTQADLAKSATFLEELL